MHVRDPWTCKSINLGLVHEFYTDIYARKPRTCISITLGFVHEFYTDMLGICRYFNLSIKALYMNFTQICMLRNHEHVNSINLGLVHKFYTDMHAREPWTCKFINLFIVHKFYTDIMLGNHVYM